MNPQELTPPLLVAAYSQGLFPMGWRGKIHWFCPDPRAIVPLDQFHISKTLAQTCRKGVFELRTDTAFAEVMKACADRPEGTWITKPILEAYCELHELGMAHSVEAWQGDRLMGGLYGVSLGAAFMGESMFHRKRDASKVALVGLVAALRANDYALLDIQFITAHLRRFGAIEIPAKEYDRRLRQAIRRKRAWSLADPGC